MKSSWSQQRQRYFRVVIRVRPPLDRELASPVWQHVVCLSPQKRLFPISKVDFCKHLNCLDWISSTFWFVGQRFCIYMIVGPSSKGLYRSAPSRDTDVPSSTRSKDKKLIKHPNQTRLILIFRHFRQQELMLIILTSVLPNKNCWIRVMNLGYFHTVSGEIAMKKRWKGPGATISLSMSSCILNMVIHVYTPDI